MTFGRSIIRVLAVAAFLAGPTSWAAGEQPEQSWGEAQGGLRVSIATDKSHCVQGTAIELRIEAENVSAETRHLIVMNETTDFDLQVTLPTGEPAPLTLYGQQRRRQATAGLFRSRTIAPGDSCVIRTMRLNAYYDMSLTGTYRIVVRKPIGSQDDPTKTLILESRPITFDVLYEGEEPRR